MVPVEELVLRKTIWLLWSDGLHSLTTAAQLLTAQIVPLSKFPLLDYAIFINNCLSTCPTGEFHG
jgi:hypothetical protein